MSDSIPGRPGELRSLAGLRENYMRGGLSEADASADPIVQFRSWFEQALAAALPEPNAMTLATVSAAGRPSARIVLLKGLDRGGFLFYTNYESQKGRELAGNPNAALVFYWAELERQVRISGRAAQISREQSEAYFHSRPAGSQLGAWASEQSTIVSGRAVLEERLSELQSRWEGQTIPLPPLWGGYRLEPETLEFWQGRPNRLHDRLRYRLTDGQWVRERLAP